MAWAFLFCITCIKIVNFDICLVKSKLLNVELLYINDIFCEYRCRGPSGHYFTHMWTMCGHCKLVGTGLYLG